MWRCDSEGSSWTLGGRPWGLMGVQVMGILKKAPLADPPSQQHLKAWAGQGQSEVHGPGLRPELLTGLPTGARGHLAWTEGPPQALAPSPTQAAFPLMICVTGPARGGLHASS